MEVPGQQRPTVRQFERSQEVVATALDLVRRLGEPIWVPAAWPPEVGGPDHILLLAPMRSRRTDYQLRGFNEEGHILIVHGHFRSPGNLESGLVPVDGERFETLTRPSDQPPHVVIRTPTIDVHISGRALSPHAALALGRELIEVSADG